HLRLVFFVTQQRINAVRLLRKEFRGRLSAGGEDRTIDDAEHAPLGVDEREFLLRGFLIDAELVFLDLIAMDETQFVTRFFRPSVWSHPRHPPALNAILANLRQARTCA